jgi:hypothetical protein
MLNFLSTYIFQALGKFRCLSRIPIVNCQFAAAADARHLAALTIRLYIGRRPLSSTGIP